MKYMDDILNVYAYLRSKSRETAEASVETVDQIVRLDDAFSELNEQTGAMLSDMDDALAKAYAMCAQFGVDTTGISGEMTAEETALPEPVNAELSGEIRVPISVGRDFRKDFRRLVREANEAGFIDTHPEELLTAEEIACAQDFDRQLDLAFQEATRLQQKDIQVLLLAVAARVLFFFLFKKYQLLRTEMKSQMDQLRQELSGNVQTQTTAPNYVVSPDYFQKDKERELYSDFLDIAGNIRADEPIAASGIDAALGVDINSMLDSLADNKNAVKTGRKIVDKVTRKFGSSTSVLQYTTILEQNAPFDIQETDLFDREDIVAYHKYLGWIMGTVNILTDTITTYGMKSYSITRSPSCDKPVVDEEISTVFRVLKPIFQGNGLYKESIAAATVQEALTQGFGKASQQEVRTLFGRAMELENKTSAFARETQGVLRNFGRNWAEDIGGLAGTALINTVVAAIHAILYEESDGDLDAYAVRTSRILLYSGAIATTVNSLPAVAAKDITKLDLAGILTTCVSWFQSNEFWIETKTNFLVSVYKEELEKELEKLEKYFQYQL